MSYDPDQTPGASPSFAAPRRGPGRPRKPTAPRSDAQADLAAEIEETEARLDALRAAHAVESSTAAELALLCAELSSASVWGSYCRAQGDITHALKYGEACARLSGRISALRELLATDQLAALLSRAKREDALRKKGKGAR